MRDTIVNNCTCEPTSTDSLAELVRQIRDLAHENYIMAATIAECTFSDAPKLDPKEKDAKCSADCLNTMIDDTSKNLHILRECLAYIIDRMGY